MFKSFVLGIFFSLQKLYAIIENMFISIKNFLHTRLT